MAPPIKKFNDQELLNSIIPDIKLIYKDMLHSISSDDDFVAALKEEGLDRVGSLRKMFENLQGVFTLKGVFGGRIIFWQEIQDFIQADVCI